MQYFVKDSDNRFVRCGFIAPYAANFLRNGLPVIQADMAHFRKTKFPGITPTIVGRHILPLSWGTCGPEDEAEHTYHFQKFKEAIQIQDPTLDLAGVVAFGDRDKGMVAAADRELGMMSGFHDLKHASSNIALAVKGCGLAVRMKLETAASIYTKEEARVQYLQYAWQVPGALYYCRGDFQNSV